MKNREMEKSILTKEQLERVNGGTGESGEVSSDMDPGYQTIPESGGNGQYLGKPGQNQYGAPGGK